LAYNYLILFAESTPHV